MTRAENAAAHDGPEAVQHEGRAAGLAGQLAQLTAKAEAADGVSPFNEDTVLGLDARQALIAREPDGRIAGLALYRPVSREKEREGGIEAELAVDPDHRGRGHGGRLLAALMRIAPRTVVWAHGSLPAARALARRANMAQTRLLLRLAMPIAQQKTDAPPAPPAGVRLASFRPGTDEEAFLRLNAEAFADHPEQGALDARGLRARMTEPWFHADDFLLAFQEPGGELIGYNWLKIEPGSDEGEIYVIAVAPGAAGRGVGRALMHAGLDRLRARGARRSTLYVEGDNEPAVRLYRSLGYRDDLADTQFTGYCDGSTHESQ